MVQETETVEHNEFSTFEKNESVYSEANDSICQRDTIKGDTRERGRIDIERDTAGRPVVILWAINSNFSAEASTEILEKGIFDLRGSSSSARNSGDVDSVSKKKEEAQEEINPAIPLEYLIGSSLLLLVIFYAILVKIGDYLWPWLKNLRK